MLGFSAALHLGVFVAASQAPAPAPVPSPVSAAPIPVDEIVTEAPSLGAQALDEPEKASEPSTPPPATRTPAVAQANPATSSAKLTHLPVVETAAASTDDPPVIAATAAALPHFALAPATVTASSAGAPSPTGTSGGEAGASSTTTTFGESAVDVPARLVSRGQLSYPDAARLAEIEADVPLDIVVDTTGKVVEARAALHVGYGLDQAATNAIFGYRFSPALRGGRPVRVRMRWAVVFRLN